jgi:hypothetical protein
MLTRTLPAGRKPANVVSVMKQLSDGDLSAHPATPARPDQHDDGHQEDRDKLGQVVSDVTDAESLVSSAEEVSDGAVDLAPRPSRLPVWSRPAWRWSRSTAPFSAPRRMPG